MNPPQFSLCFHAKSFPLARARIDSPPPPPKSFSKKLSPEEKMNPPSEIESSSTVSSVASSEASRWSEDETPTISDDEFIVSDSEIAEAGKLRNRKKTTLNFFMNLLSISGRKTNLSKRNLPNKTIFSGKFTMN